MLVVTNQNLKLCPNTCENPSSSNHLYLCIPKLVKPPSKIINGAFQISYVLFILPDLLPNSEDEVLDEDIYADKELEGVEEHKSVILHLLSQLKLGMDLTKVNHCFNSHTKQVTQAVAKVNLCLILQKRQVIPLLTRVNFCLSSKSTGYCNFYKVNLSQSIDKTGYPSSYQGKPVSQST